MARADLIPGGVYVRRRHRPPQCGTEPLLPPGPSAGPASQGAVLGHAARPPTGTPGPQPGCRSSGRWLGTHRPPREGWWPSLPLFRSPGEMGLSEGGSSLSQRCLLEGLRRVIPVHGGTSCTPGPTASLGTATATAWHRRANGRRSHRPMVGPPARSQGGQWPPAWPPAQSGAPVPQNPCRQREPTEVSPGGRLATPTAPSRPNPLPSHPHPPPSHHSLPHNIPTCPIASPPVLSTPLLPDHPPLPLSLHLQPPHGHQLCPSPCSSQTCWHCQSRQAGSRG